MTPSRIAPRLARTRAAFRNSPSLINGAATRCSIRTKAASSTSPAAALASVCTGGTSAARTTVATSNNIAPVRVTAPALSSGSA